MKKLSLLAVLTVMALIATTSSGLIINDPTGLSSNLNTLNKSVVSNLGNFTLAQYNATPASDRLAFTFDSGNGYTNNNTDLTAVNLTSTVSGVSFNLYLSKAGGTYGNRLDTGANRQSSGNQSLAYQSAVTGVTNFIYSFNRGVYGVAFLLTRYAQPVTVQVWSASAQIGGDYVYAADSTTNFSFFGYRNLSTAEVRQVKVLMAANTGPWADDVGVVLVPEPLSAILLLAGAPFLLFLRRIVRAHSP